MKSIAKIIIMASITFGTVGALYILDSVFDELDFNYEDTYIFVDSLGREVEVPKHPERIISMSPVVTETLYALEVEDRIVGVTDYCDYPEDAQDKPSIGGFTSPNLEVIIGLEPDLVIWTVNDPTVIESLEEYDITIVVLLVNDLEQAIERIEDIGDLVDAEDIANDISTVMIIKMDWITSKTSTLTESQKLKCYFEVWSTPKVVGALSFLNDMMIKAGATNIFGDIDEEYATVSHEVVISENPEVIFITAMGRDYYQEDISERAGYQNVDAVKDDKIYVCDDNKFTRAGPRIVDALEEMAHYLYPSLIN